MTTTTTKTKRAGKGLSRAVLAGATLSVFSLTSIGGAMAAVTPANDSVNQVDGKGMGVEYVVDYYAPYYATGEDVEVFIGSLTVADKDGEVIDDLYAWCVELFNNHVEGLAADDVQTMTGEQARLANYIIQAYQDDVNMHPEIAAAMHDLLDESADLVKGDFYNWSGADRTHSPANSWGNLRYLVENGYDSSEWGQWSIHPDGYMANIKHPDNAYWDGGSYSTDTPYVPIGGAAPLADVLDGADALIAEAEQNAGNYTVDFEFGEVDSRENTVDVTVNVLDGAGDEVAADQFTNRDGEGIELDLTIDGTDGEEGPLTFAEGTETEGIAPGTTVTLEGVYYDTNINLEATSNEVFPGDSVERHHYDDEQDKVYIGSVESISGSIAVPAAVEPTAPDSPEVDVEVRTQASANEIVEGESFYDYIEVTGVDGVMEYLDENQTVESQLWYTGDVDPTEHEMSYEEFQEALESGEIEAELVEEYTTEIDGNTVEYDVDFGDEEAAEGEEAPEADEDAPADEDVEDTDTGGEGEGNVDADAPVEGEEGVTYDGVYTTDEFTADKSGFYVYTESITVDDTTNLEDPNTGRFFDVPVQASSQSDFGIAAETVFVEEAPADGQSQKQKQKQKQKQEQGQEQNQNQEVIIEIVNNPSFNFSFDKDGNIINDDTGEIVDPEDVIDEVENGDDTDNGDDNGDNGDNGDGSGDGNGQGGGAGDGDDTDGPKQSDPKENPDANGKGGGSADNTKVISGNTSGGEMAAWGAGLLGLAGAAGLAARKFFRRGTEADEA